MTNKSCRKITLFATKLLQISSAAVLLLPCAALAGPPGSGWKQVFSDDFNGSELDTSKWSPCFYWGNESGCTNGGAGDLQWFSPNNVIVENGKLRLRAEKRSTNGLNYTSGMIASHDKFSFQYGYAEFRAKVPKGNGFWPTFWLLAQDKSWPPEIDVAEFIGSNTNNAHLTLHYRSGGQRKSTTGWASGADYSDGFHTYAVEWGPDKIIWYVDGVESKRYTGEGIPQESMYLAATFALGKAWSNYGPDGSTPLPGYVDIDYIKVWRRE